MPRAAAVAVATLAAAGVLAATVARAHAAPVTGTVYVDLDRDGLFSTGDRPLAGVVVGWETTAFATTGADGRYQLPEPSPGKPPGIVWASVPDGYEPGPVWARVDTRARGERIHDLGLRPASATGPLQFVHASDTHLGNVSTPEMQVALRQAADLAPAPHFLVITGDLTANTAASELAGFDVAIAELTVPFVPVVGNHDWHDGGPKYRERFGPPMYSFSTGGAHFIVLNFNDREDSILDFVLEDLRLHPRAAEDPVVVFTHAPPDDHVVEVLAELGVDYLFTGHVHSNRVLRRSGMLEYNTQALAMGGFDYTPAGYRVVSMTDAGLVVEHHTVVDERIARMMWPREGDCIPAGPTPVIAAVELGATRARVSVSVDGGAPLALAPRGGWTWGRELDVPTGWHTLDLLAQAGTNAPDVRQQLRFCVVARAPERGAGGDWSQLGGSAMHSGVAPTPTGVAPARLAPPLRTVWARTVGGHLLGGSPVIAGTRVLVPVVDYAAGDAGGLVAFDLRSGRELWHARAGAAVHGTPVTDGARVITLDVDGMLRAHDVATGALVWSHDAAEGIGGWQRSTTTTPALADGVVVVTVQQRVRALDAATGALLWEDRLGTEEISHSRAAPLIAGGLVVATTGRGKDGLIAWELRSGQRRWRSDPRVSRSLAAAPVSDGVHVYAINVQSEVFALRLATGGLKWQRQLYGHDDSGLIDWRFGPLATPALTGGTLYLPTPKRRLWALDVDDGLTRWRHDAQPGMLRMLPLYGRGAHGFVSSPVVSGSWLWLAGADGLLRALSLESGALVWQANLGTPLVSGLAAAGDFLVVASYDGTVRVMTPGVSDPALHRGDGVRARGVAAAAGLGFLLLLASVGLWGFWRRVPV